MCDALAKPRIHPAVLEFLQLRCGSPPRVVVPFDVHDHSVIFNGDSLEKRRRFEFESCIGRRGAAGAVVAGWVPRDDGSAVMMMVRSTKGGAAERIAGAAALTRAMDEKVVVKPALWDSRQLLTFKDKVFAMASTKGVIATSIDREINRVQVTYNVDLDANAIEALALKLVGAGVPRAAVVMKPGEQPKSIATTGVSLRLQPLPLAAGAQFG